MGEDTVEARAECKVRLAAFLLPHLKGDEAERGSVLNTVLTALNTTHADGVRHAARFCRTIGTTAHRHGEVALALADGIEAIAAREDAEAAQAALQWLEQS